MYYKDSERAIQEHAERKSEFKPQVMALTVNLPLLINPRPLLCLHDPGVIFHIVIPLPIHS